MKDNYKAEMDSIKMPDDVASNILQKMLEENSRLRGEQAVSVTDEQTVENEKVIPIRKHRRSWAAVASLAACLCIVLGISALRGGNIMKINYSELPGDGIISRAPGDDLPELSEFLVGVLDPGAEIEGYSCTDLSYGTLSSVNENRAHYIAQMEYHRGEKGFNLTAATLKTVLAQTLEGGKATDVSGKSVFFGRDKSAGLYYAYWQQDGVFFTMSSSQLELSEMEVLISAV